MCLSFRLENKIGTRANIDQESRASAISSVNNVSRKGRNENGKNAISELINLGENILPCQTFTNCGYFLSGEYSRETNLAIKLKATQMPSKSIPE